MAINRTKLTLDLETLFPGDSITICGQLIDVKPLGLKQLAMVARKLKGFGSILEEQGVTWDNYGDPENIIKLAVVLLEQAPEVLEEASNIAIEDLEQLPIDIIVELLDKVIEVNMQSKDKFVGNCKSLAGKFNLGMKMTPKSKSRKRSKN